MKHIVATIFLCFLGLQSLYAQKETIMLEDNVKAPPTSLKYWIEQNEVRTEHHISFVAGKAEILTSSTPALNTVKKYLDDKSYISTLRIEGHVSCGQGAQALSEARAQAVCKWLVDHGVDCKRLIPVGFGCTKPIMDDHNEANARITFVNAALRGRAIGGMPADGGGKVAGDACGINSRLAD